MSKLNIDQKTIMGLFSDSRADFLIPDYQRPYAWGELECQTLWDDIFTFAIPDEDFTKFDKNDEYFLGPIVTFKNDQGKMEVIDGQQRLTTLMLLLRAFYAKFSNMKDKNSLATKKNIEECIWKTNEFDEPNMDSLKIDSVVATDNDKDEFLKILKSGIVEKEQKSNYANNYRFFQMKISEFLDKYPIYFAYLPTRILKNCILLPIEAESQDTALRIFSTLNDRGKPLSDADIFKAQFYKYFSKEDRKDEFIRRWKKLEEICEKTFTTGSNTPMDEIFTRYMYFLRAKKNITQSTTEALRKFFERDGYRILHDDKALSELEVLARFWNDVSNQDTDRFSDRILRRLFVLNYAPNGMWSYFVSVYFLKNKDENENLDDDKFFNFLLKITGFIWAYALINPGVNALRTPIYAEMVKVVNGESADFSKYKFDREKVIATFNNSSFDNRRPITKSMLAWWAFNNPKQKCLSIDTPLEIEHIYAKNRYDMEKSLKSRDYLELLGNKSLLEKRINIRVSDYRFADKIKYYKGYTSSHGEKQGTDIYELRNMSDDFNDFTEKDILERNGKIINGFIDFLDENSLLQ